MKDLQLPTFDQASSSGGVGGDFVLLKGEEELIPVGITPFILSKALPVVPPKLNKRIINVDMAEMLSAQ